MISISHLTPGKRSGDRAARDVAQYVERDAASPGAAGYYQEHGAAPSQWYGAGAAALGLTGQVRHDDLVQALQGHLPSGVDVSARSGREGAHRMATDLTWSVDKSVAMILASGVDPRLADVASEAARVVADVIEREIIYARHGHGGREREYTAKAVIAAHTHEATRTEDGRADPDWHVHFLVLNATQRSDGTWSNMKLDFGEASRILKIADAAGKASLAWRLQELGYRIRRTDNGFEIEGISREQIEKFSRRKSQIDAELERRGLTRETATAAERAAANLATRGNKSTLEKSEQQWQWRQEYREAGVDIDAIVARARERAAAGPIPIADLSEEAARAGARDAGEREAVFDVNAARLSALRAGMGSVTLQTVDHQVGRKVGGLIDVGGGKRTTLDALRTEQSIQSKVRAMQDTVAPITSSDLASVAAEKAATAESKTFSRSQIAGIVHSCTTPDQVTGVVGLAGAGKTTALKVVVDVYQSRGFEVIGLGPTTKAVHELRDAGADTTRTMQSVLAANPVPGGEKRLYLIDEAGMISAKDMLRLVERAQLEGAKTILVGDYRQLHSVEHGIPFEQLIKSGALRIEKIDEIQRQRNAALRECVQAYGDGDAKRGMELAKPFTTVVEPTADDFATVQREKASAPEQDAQEPEPTLEPTTGMVNYAESLGMAGAADATFEEVRQFLDDNSPKILGFDAREGGKENLAPKAVRQEALARTAAERYLSLSHAERASTAVATISNQMRQKINEKIRAELQARGEIAKAETVVSTLRDTRMTREQRTHVELYKPDQVVRITEGRGRGRKVTDYTVDRVEGERAILRSPWGEERQFDPATFDQKRFQVFDREDKAFAAGDKIIFRQPDREYGVANGQGGDVVAIDPAKHEMTVRMDDNRDITLRTDEHQAIDRGWCRTVHDLQGATVDRVIGAVESGRAATAELAYVTLSRARDRAEVLTDSWGRLQKSINKFVERETALRATGAAATVDLQRLDGLRQEAAQERGREGDLAQAREAVVPESPAPAKDQAMEKTPVLELRR